MRRALCLLGTVVLVAGCASTASNGDNRTANSTKSDTAAAAPVTDASAPPQRNPEGAPVRPLTNLPSTSLVPEGSEKQSGRVFFEPAGKGIAVRIQSLDVRHGPLPAMVASGPCAKPGKRLYALKPVVSGTSITTLPNVTFAQLAKAKDTVRVEQPGGKREAQCALVYANEVPTR